MLVVCDYATRYPEAVPLQTIDAEHIAEELVQIFSQVGMPSEILTGQGSNYYFMSQLLGEVYRLLRVKPIRNNPYHPQTEGLVEHFNKTLKAMLHKTAISEGKDWDKLLPYILFAYREVPQASMGFSPFELLYGRSVRGPLDILSWEASTKSSKSIVSYVLMMWEKLYRMTELVQENLSRAQANQKQWYDQTAQSREFNPGDKIHVLLPTSTNKLQAQWQGPYTVIQQNGPANYVIDMHNKQKCHCTFHVNMIKRWYEPVERGTTSFLMTEEAPGGKDVLTWDNTVSDKPAVGDQLSTSQWEELQQVIQDYPNVFIFSTRSGLTRLAEHKIETNQAKPVCQPPYRLPHAYRDMVKGELRSMQENGIIKPSTSDWAAPIVLVGKRNRSLRFCVVYRKLKDRPPWQSKVHIHTQFDTWILAGASSGGIPWKDSVYIPYELYHFRVMPFGLHCRFDGVLQELHSGLCNHGIATN